MFFILYTITALFTPPILFFDKYSEVQLATPSPEPFESEAPSEAPSDPRPSDSPSDPPSDPRSDPLSDPRLNDSPSDPPSDISIIFSDEANIQLVTPSPEPFESEAETISFLFGSSNIFFDEAKIQLVTPSPEPLEISPINPNSRQWRLESLLTDTLGWIERQGIECAVRRVTRTIFQF
jgi:hypothetical protein